jgi:hypothetical protein
MRILKRQEILAASALKTEKIPAPEWGEDCCVLVRALSGLQREAMDRHVYESRKAGNPYSILGNIAAHSIIDEDGHLMFSADEMMALAEVNQAPLERIWDWQTKHSGLGGKALDDAVKNSEPGQNGAGSSATSGVSAG